MKDTKVLSDNEIRKLEAIVERMTPAIVDTAISRAFVSAIERRKQNKRDMLKELEDLLRSKETLEDNVEENELKLKNLEMGIQYKTMATDIVRMAQNRLTKEQIEEGRLIHLKAKIEADKLNLERIEGALNHVRYRKNCNVIELKYLQDMEDEEVAEEMDINIAAVRWFKNKYLKMMAVKIYGSEFLGE